jgi:two-component SAPR family response regulator
MKALSVLVVENDLFLGRLLGETLEMMGHIVCSIETTVEGTLAAVFRFNPDLIIIDILLQDGSGISVLENTCSYRFVPHIFISCYISGITKSRPNAIVLQKPFREAKLASYIEHALEYSEMYGSIDRPFP